MYVRCMSGQLSVLGLSTGQPCCVGKTLSSFNTFLLLGQPDELLGVGQVEFEGMFPDHEMNYSTL